MKTAKLVKNGRSQAVGLRAEFRTELTYLLFAQDGTRDRQRRPASRWLLLGRSGGPARTEPPEFYKVMLIHLGTHGSRLVQEIYANARPFIRKPATLSTS